MATRGDIKDAFYDELVTNVTGTYDITDSGGTVVDTITIEEADIALINPETSEKNPGIVFDDFYTPITFNGVGGGLYRVEESGGTEDFYEFREYRRGQFDVFVQAPSEAAKEPIYEAMHRTFHTYQFSEWFTSSFQSDVIDIRVESTVGNDAVDAEDIIRGDSMTVLVDYYRTYEFTTDNIDEIVSQIDADNDGTIDINFSTT